MLTSYRERLRRVLPSAAAAFAEMAFSLVGFVWTLVCCFCCIIMFAASVAIVNAHVLPWVPFWPESWYAATSLVLAVPMTVIGFFLLELVGLLAFLLFLAIILGIATLVVSGWQRLTGTSKNRPSPPPDGGGNS